MTPRSAMGDVASQAAASTTRPEETLHVNLANWRSDSMSSRSKFGQSQSGALPNQQRKPQSFGEGDRPSCPNCGGSRLRQAVGTLIGRSDGRVALPHERGLAVETDQVQVGCCWPFGNDRPRVRRCRVVGELIVQLARTCWHGKVGSELLRAAEERGAVVAVPGEQILSRAVQCGATGASTPAPAA